MKLTTRKKNSSKKNPKFAKEAFSYDVDGDFYTCPQGHRLASNRNEYQKKAYGQHRAPYKFKRYTCSYKICKHCPFKDDCVGPSPLKARKGRHIERSEFAEYTEENARRYKVSKELYRERQALVEHQFGTIKRQWGFDYTLLKTRQKVDGEFAIVFTCYNLRRAISILGIRELIQTLKKNFIPFFDENSSILILLKGLFQKSFDTLISRNYFFCSKMRSIQHLWLFCAP